MNAREWISYFGKSSLHPDLAQALFACGITEPVMVEKGHVNMTIRLGDYYLHFKDEAVFDDLEEDVGEGVGVLNAVSMSVGPDDTNPYPGELPYGLARGDTQSGVRAKLGPPAREDEIMPFDEWDIDALMLKVNYDDEDEDNVVIETVYLAMRE